MRYSLVIPLAPERSAEIIDSIKQLDYPKDKFHVVVVEGKNPSNNRNRGAIRAKGDIIIFLDDDALINNNYLRRVDDFFARHPDIDIVGGPQLTPKSDSGFARISGYGLGSKFGAWKLSNRYSLNQEVFDVDETALTSANLICKKHIFDKVKFDENLFPGEDPKFISDAKKVGFSVAYTPKILVYHRRRPTLNGFIIQMFNYGKTRPKLATFYETLKIPFFFIPSIFLLYLLVLIFSIGYDPTITGNVIGAFDQGITPQFLIFVPFLAYVLLAVGFSLFDSSKNRDLKSFIPLMFIYPIIHLSYGAGMIWGYLRKLA